MSFLDKLKNGVSEAGSKAKVLVEINKLKLINVSKQNDITQLYKDIGEKVVLTAKSGQELRMEYFAAELEKIDMLNTEIEQNQLKIVNLSDDKLCLSCQKNNSIHATHCVHCGASFIVGDQQVIEPTYIDLPGKQKQEDKNE